MRGRAFGEEVAGARHQTVCGAFLKPGVVTIGGVRLGLMAGLACRSGSTEVLWLQALHLYT